MYFSKPEKSQRKLSVGRDPFQKCSERIVSKENVLEAFEGHTVASPDVFSNPEPCCSRSRASIERLDRQRNQSQQ